MTKDEEIKARWALLKKDRTLSPEMEGDIVRTDGVPKTAAGEVKQDELNELISRSRDKGTTLRSESHLMPKTAFLAGFAKAADVSKEELRQELKKHEERETPAQEKAESKEEQRIEREAGVEKEGGVAQTAFGTVREAGKRNVKAVKKFYNDHIKSDFSERLDAEIAQMKKEEAAEKNASLRAAARVVGEKARHAAGRVGAHLDKNFDRYVAGTGTAAAITGAHAGVRSARAREEQLKKHAFLGGFGKARKERKHDEARMGFLAAATDIHHRIHPLPSGDVDKWAQELHPDKHQGFHAGFNHFSDRFNEWLPTKEGKKWNNAQAKKWLQTEEGKRWGAKHAGIGFAKAAALFTIKHQIDGGTAGDAVTKTLDKLRNLRGRHLLAGGAMAGLGFGAASEGGKRLVGSIGKKTEPKPD